MTGVFCPGFTPSSLLGMKEPAGSNQGRADGGGTSWQRAGRPGLLITVANNIYSLLHHLAACHASACLSLMRPLAAYCCITAHLGGR
jgi:hypothetical protein